MPERAAARVSMTPPAPLPPRAASSEVKNGSYGASFIRVDRVSCLVGPSARFRQGPEGKCWMKDERSFVRDLIGATMFARSFQHYRFVILCILFPLELYSTEIRLVGPSTVRPGQTAEFVLEARNSDIQGQQTRSIDWRLTGTQHWEFSTPLKPVSHDFFSDENWDPFPTDDILMLPPTASGRFTLSQSDLVVNKDFAAVAVYLVVLVPAYYGPFPATASFFSSKR